MFYKHSNIGGRIQSSDATAYNPGGLGAGEIKGSNFAFGDARTKAITDGSSHSAAASVELPPALKRTRQLQVQYLAAHQSGVPVHMLRGTPDLIATRGTLGLSVIGLGYFSYVMYRMAYGLK